MEKELTTPILFLIFNRPETTARVFAEIKKAVPKKLFIAADGPRASKPGEAERCQAARDIIKQIDWDCEIKTLFREKNLGCKKAVSSALNWFFENVEEGIILEDDCLPHQSFFQYCQELLAYYRNDERIMHISGNNFQNNIVRGDGSYYFSRFSHIWGWASWRRAWAHYDVEMKTWPSFLAQNQIVNVFENKNAQKYFLNALQSVFAGKIDTWDYQWNYALWSQNGLATLPNKNLVSNIGFGQNATHTAIGNNQNANMRTETLNNIIHPVFVSIDKEADDFTFINQFEPPQNTFVQLKKLVKRALKLL